MHQIQCQCGTVSGHLEGTGISNRAICYCADCRAFARFLGRSDDVLDEQGGTEVVQVAQHRLRFSRGKAHLAAVRLSEKGMLRWYAQCCSTPLGNTMLNPKMSFIGLVHSPLDRAHMDRDFGEKVARVNTASATSERKPKAEGLPGAIVRLLWIALASRISGDYKKTELFDEHGVPIVRPRVLSAEELEGLKKAV